MSARVNVESKYRIRKLHNRETKWVCYRPDGVYGIVKSFRHALYYMEWCEVQKELKRRPDNVGGWILNNILEKILFGTSVRVGNSKSWSSSL